MLKKSKATPYTIIERMSIHTPDPGLPAPKRPKRRTHANIAMSITLLMPKIFIATGMRRMPRVSDICEIEMRALALRAPHVSANSGTSLKCEMNGFAKPFVICNDTPSRIEKMKKIC